MKRILTVIMLLASCWPITRSTEKIIIVNEGMWQTDNGRLTYFEDGVVKSNQWFRDVNGSKLGDTPNDIIQINDNLIAITLNWSNIVQFITPDGHAVAATEDIPNNRKLASDGKFLYVTSYAHEVGINGEYRQFEKGYVAKIDVSNFNVIDAVEVGYEPEGIALYQGKLFVANSGGYAFQEGHEYETTIDVIDAETMTVIRNIETGQINLYGKISQSGSYLCINSPGDYYDEEAATIILDCEAVLSGKADSECFKKLDYASTANCVNNEGTFYAIGSRYSYYTGQYEFNYVTIDPVEVFRTGGTGGVTSGLPGTMVEEISRMSMPYGLYVNPYTGYIYATDAGAYTGAGELLQWDPNGNLLGRHKVYINPAHFLALNPLDGTESAANIYAETDEDQTPIYNLQGIRINNPRPGTIYIKNGKKIIF